MRNAPSESNIVSLIAVLIAIWIIALIPFAVIGHGFLPPDDALWHSSKAFSGKCSSEVLVQRAEVTMETHPGWDAILGAVHRVTNWDVHSLVLFSVISLFILFSIIPIFFLRYPESWLLSMLTISIATPGWFFRLFLGRPYIVTMAAILVMLFLWPKLKSKKNDYGVLALLTFVIAISTWAHRTWYILLAPVIALLLAREWRASLRLAISLVAGIFIGSALTGHPILLMKDTILHLWLVSTSCESQGMFVTELRPLLCDFGIVVLVAAMLFWRFTRGRWNRAVIDNPIFILMVLCFIGRLVTNRIWLDVGIPALAIWIAGEFHDFLDAKMGRRQWNRIFLTVALAGTLYLSITSDAGSRWSGRKHQDYLSSEDPTQAGWLPGPGGIIYSDDMGVFFQTVFKNPTANWRYILGPESALMPEKDLKILREIQENRQTYKLFEPWVKKMRPEDRLIIRGDEDHKPKIPELEWKYAALGTWVGRKSR